MVVDLNVTESSGEQKEPGHTLAHWHTAAAAAHSRHSTRRPALPPQARHALAGHGSCGAPSSSPSPLTFDLCSPYSVSRLRLAPHLTPTGRLDARNGKTGAVGLVWASASTMEMESGAKPPCIGSHPSFRGPPHRVAKERGRQLGICLLGTPKPDKPGRPGQPRPRQGPAWPSMARPRDMLFHLGTARNAASLVGPWHHLALPPLAPHGHQQRDRTKSVLFAMCHGSHDNAPRICRAVTTTRRAQSPPIPGTLQSRPRPSHRARKPKQHPELAGRTVPPAESNNRIPRALGIVFPKLERHDGV